MKKLLITTAVFTAASTALFAQTLSITAPGYSGGKLFDATPGFLIEGLAAAPLRRAVSWSLSIPKRDHT